MGNDPADQVPFRGLSPPPGPRVPYVPLWYPQTVCGSKGTALDSGVIWLPTHWSQERQRTVVCTGQGHCDLCGEHRTPRFTAYLGCFHWGHRAWRIAVITRSAWDCSPTLQEWDGRLTSRTIRSYRLREGARAPTGIQVSEPEIGSMDLPKFHTVKVLARVLGFNIHDVHAAALDGLYGDNFRPRSAERGNA